MTQLIKSERGKLEHTKKWKPRTTILRTCKRQYLRAKRMNQCIIRKIYHLVLFIFIILGWDGKPIPYWLFKLHGLGIEYKCEICGNYSYWGRRAFERHFTEWRHSYGMKCLKIPNTIHFREITSINDALAIHQKLLMESELSQFKPDLEEEFEDSEGNLLNRKTYYDLKRQGLL